MCLRDMGVREGTEVTHSIKKLHSLPATKSLLSSQGDFQSVLTRDSSFLPSTEYLG